MDGQAGPPHRPIQDGACLSRSVSRRPGSAAHGTCPTRQRAHCMVTVTPCNGDQQDAPGPRPPPQSRGLWETAVANSDHVRCPEGNWPSRAPLRGSDSRCELWAPEPSGMWQPGFLYMCLSGTATCLAPAIQSCSHPLGGSAGPWRSASRGLLCVHPANPSGQGSFSV